MRQIVCCILHLVVWGHCCKAIDAQLYLTSTSLQAGIPACANEHPETGYGPRAENHPTNNSRAKAPLPIRAGLHQSGSLTLRPALTSNDIPTTGAVIPNGGFIAANFCFSARSATNPNGEPAFPRSPLTGAGGLEADLISAALSDRGYERLPELRSSLMVKGVDVPTSDICGHFDLILQICIRNTGNVPLQALNGSIDLNDAHQLGSTFAGVTHPPTMVSSDTESPPTPNVLFDGTNDLLQGDGQLYPGESICLRFTVEIAPEAAGAPANPRLQLTVQAETDDQQVLTDLTDDGEDPSSNNPGAPGDTGGEDDPTLLMDCWRRSYQVSANDELNLSINRSCQVNITPNLVLENYSLQCDAPLPLGSYYKLQLLSADGDGFLPNPFDASDYTGREILFVVQPVARHCAPLWGKIRLEDKVPPTACIRKVVGLHRTQVTDDKDADHHLAGGNPVYIDDQYFSFEPVTNEEATCIDAIRDNSYLAAPDTRLLICSDVDSILNVAASWEDAKYAYYTGAPDFSDNCSGSRVSLTQVRDQLVDYECFFGAPVPGLSDRLVTHLIRRSFLFSDESGNRGEVTQEICFFKPVVELPACEEYIDVCENNHLDPDETELELAPALIQSAPQYANALGLKMYLDQHACSIAAAFKDVVVAGPANCGFKVIRSWTILDWCWNELIYNGPAGAVALINNENEGCPEPVFSDWLSKTLQYEQHLIVGDRDVPELECPQKADNSAYVFSTGPFDCTGSFVAPAPVLINNECVYTWTVEVYSELPVLWHGVPTGEFEIVPAPGVVVVPDYGTESATTNSVTVEGLPQGKHFLRYIVTDQCGNTGFSDASFCPVFIIDQTPPVVIADDELVVGLSSTNGNAGFGQLLSTDIDEGSHDNCDPVHLQVRRFVPAGMEIEFLASSNLSLNAESVIIDREGTEAHGIAGRWTEWSEYVDFLCTDVAETGGKVLIELGAWDNANNSATPLGQPIYGDQAPPFADVAFSIEDNFNKTWLEIRIQDRTAPTCFAPHDLALNCTDIPLSITMPDDATAWNNLSESRQAEFENWFETLEKANHTYAFAEDNCNASIAVRDVTFKIQCNSGYIERSFQATDDSGLASPVCKQRIYLRRHDNYCIKFPQDVTANCVGDPQIPGVELFQYSCDLLAVSARDEKFDVPASDGACYKILRTYRVLNWCQFSADIDPDTPLFDRFDSSLGVEPLVLGRDEDGDGVPGNEDIYVKYLGWETDVSFRPEILRYYEQWGLSGHSIAEEGSEGVTWIDSKCDPDDHERYNPTAGGYLRKAQYSRGFYQYTQVITVTDTEAPAITRIGSEKFPAKASLPIEGKDELFINGLPVTCTGTVELDIEVREFCSTGAVSVYAVELLPDNKLGIGPRLLYSSEEIRHEGNAFDLVITEERDSEVTSFHFRGNFPVGSHSLEVYVQDGCRNIEAISIPFEVYDAIGLSPVCQSTLSFNLAAGNGLEPSASVWASDFIAGEKSDCSSNIRHTVYRRSAIDDLEARGEGLFPGFQTDAKLTITCEDPDFLPVYIYSWDENGNYGRCEAFIIVANRETICSAPAGIASITGKIMTENSESVSGVEVDLSGEMRLEMTTADNGTFHFENVPVGYDVTVTPQKHENPLNGVTTYDLVVISKHILGTHLLDSPYKMIAADVNNSGDISTLDMIHMRKLILSVDREFRFNTSWRFVERGYEFPDPSNPWLNTFPELYRINNLARGLPDKDFIGIKVGDVTADAIPNELVVEPRKITGTFTIKTEDRKLDSGKIYDIQFLGNQIQNILGYQFTLSYSPEVELLDIIYGIAGAENFGIKDASDRSITTSWNRAGNVTEGNGNEAALLFSLRVLAHQSVRVSELFNINSRLTRAVAYDHTADSRGALDVLLKFEDEAIAVRSFELHQNTPNPFAVETRIGFRIPKRAQVSLLVRDPRGQIVGRYRGEFAGGYNEFLLPGHDLPDGGLLFYTIETQGFQATRKMTLFK